jgi:hypothetical protein
MNKTITIAIIIGSLIIGGGIIISQTMKQSSIERQQRAEIEAEREAIELKAQKEREAEETKQALIDYCMDIAYQLYSENWDSACMLLNKGRDCNLPGFRADDLDKQLAEEKKNCLNRF